MDMMESTRLWLQLNPPPPTGRPMEDAEISLALIFQEDSWLSQAAHIFHFNIVRSNELYFLALTPV